MTIESKILRDLDVGSTTISSLQERIHVKPEALEVVLNRLKNEGIVNNRVLYPSNLLVWYKVNKPVLLQKQYHEI